MGVFEDAESNGGVLFPWKWIFGVESIDSTIAKRSILIDLLKLGRFLTKLRIWGFSRALNRMAVFVFLENWYLGSNRSIRLQRSDRSWSIFWNLVDFWRNFGYGDFPGRWIKWRCQFSLTSISVVESSFGSVGATSAPMTSRNTVLQMEGEIGILQKLSRVGLDSIWV